MREELLAPRKGRAGEIPRANLAIAGQLAKLGNTIDQLVRLALAGQVPIQLEPMLRQLFGAVALYQRELLEGPGKHRPEQATAKRRK